MVCGGELVSALLAGLAARETNTEIWYMDCGYVGGGRTIVRVGIALKSLKKSEHSLIFISLYSALQDPVRIYMCNERLFTMYGEFSLVSGPLTTRFGRGACDTTDKQ